MHILLTNDDGVTAPGLLALALELRHIGKVSILAPDRNWSGGGHVKTLERPLRIKEVLLADGSCAMASDGAPSDCVALGLLGFFNEKIDLVVSGINYGENVGSGVTISGTVGAAMEGASLGIPALAASLETSEEHHLSYSADVDFSTAAYFTAYFARLLLERKMPQDVHLLKVDVPGDATPETAWQITRLSMNRYFEPLRPTRTDWSQRGAVGYRRVGNIDLDPHDTDAYAVRIKRVVAVTPLSLDLTSRVNFQELDKLLRRD